jgi:chemotaxis protein CheX
MDVSFINHFIESTANVFDTMLSCKVKRTSLQLKTGCQPTHEVSAVIGLSGKVTGSVVLSLTRNVALKSVEQMLFDEFTEINAEVVDGVGELANMIAGGAKAAMEDLQLALGLPNVIIGNSHEVYFPGSVQPISVGFETPWGPMAIDVGFNASLEGNIESISDRKAVLV